MKLRNWGVTVAVVVLAALVGCADAQAQASSQATLAVDQIATISVNPADTCAGILPAESSDGSDRHFVSAPLEPANRKPVLMVFLGGSTQ